MSLWDPKPKTWKKKSNGDLEFGSGNLQGLYHTLCLPKAYDIICKKKSPLIIFVMNFVSLQSILSIKIYYLNIPRDHYEKITK